MLFRSAAAAKKSGRVAAEGLVGVASVPAKAAMVEVNAETDFVARNVLFQDFVETATKLAMEVKGDVEALKAKPHPGEKRTVGEQLTHLVATVGENMAVRRANGGFHGGSNRAQRGGPDSCQPAEAIASRSSRVRRSTLSVVHRPDQRTAAAVCAGTARRDTRGSVGVG